MLSGKSILIVEDEPIVAMMLEDLLDDLGARCIGPANSADEAIALIERRSPDMAILDLNLGGERSLSVARRLREAGIPFIFATGYGSTADREFSDAEVVRKPYRRTQIVDAIRRAVDGSGSAATGR